MRDENGDLYTGGIQAPIFGDPNIISTQINDDVIAVIDVGADEHISFTDSGENALDMTFRVPAPGMQIGDTVGVNYSQDGITWEYMDSATIIDI